MTVSKLRMVAESDLLLNRFSARYYADGQGSSPLVVSCLMKNFLKFNGK